MKHKFHKMRFEISGQKLSYKLRARDATKNVVLDRNLLDAINGKKGHVMECMNALCIARLAERFPHPVFFSECRASRVYVVDKMRDGTPVSCVRYALSTQDWKEVLEFDKPDGKQRLIKAGLVEKELVLRVPNKHKPRPDRLKGMQVTGKAHGPDKSVPVKMHKTAWARAARSGRLILET